jgi:hypothetical protein
MFGQGVHLPHLGRPDRLLFLFCKIYNPLPLNVLKNGLFFLFKNVSNLEMCLFTGDKTADNV